MTSIFVKMEDDHNIFENGRLAKQKNYMEDDLMKIQNGRRPQYFWKWKMTSIFLKIEDNLNIFENGRITQEIKQPKTIKSNLKHCGTAPGNLVHTFCLDKIIFFYFFYELP